MTDKARFLKKIFGGQNLGSMGLIQSQNEVFRHFLEFGSYVFLEIVYNDSLGQCLTSSRVKIHEKNLRSKFRPNGPKLDPKLDFSTFSQVYFISFSLNCIG